MGRRATAAAAVVLALAGIAGVALLEDSPSARPGADATSAKRFRSADTLRYSYWEVALEAFADHPLKGTGSGGFAVEWRRQPDRPERAVDAHSLYIETLAELGLVGAALLALFMGGVAVAAARLGHRDPAAAAGLAAGLVTWTVHAGLDWDWELPALTGVALVLAAAAVGWDDEDLPVC
jgi:O-antigen ligase